MSQDLVKRLIDATDRGTRARACFYASIELEDEQSLGPPAQDGEAALLEQKWGRALPPSYMEFLKLHNGWVMVDGGCDLLSVEQMLAGATADKIQRWQASMLKSGEPSLAAGLVIGFSAISQKRIILDPSVTRDDGEYRLIQWDSDEFIEYESFVGWLEASAQEFEEVAAAAKNAGD